MELVAVKEQAREMDDPVLGPVCASIHAQFGDRFTPEEIEAVASHVSVRFADARIRTYIPILLRRDVVRELERNEVRKASAVDRALEEARPGAA